MVNRGARAETTATVFRVNIKSNTVTAFTPPLGSEVRPDALAAGADGNVWVDTVGGELDVLVIDPLTVKPNKMTFSKWVRRKTFP